MADDGESVALLTFGGGARPRTRHVGEFGISVLRAYWGLGLGGRMIGMLLAWAERGGIVRKVELRVHADNARGIALYERLGFTRAPGRDWNPLPELDDIMLLVYELTL